jgi:regulator of sirC expression with transglutaminase-like and TPR domain
MLDSSMLATALEGTLTGPVPDLARAAMLVASVETPALDVPAAVARLDALGRRVAARVRAADRSSVQARIDALNRAIYDDEGFRGNHAHYDDIRNSLLDVVLERRLGIPITLAVVYMVIAQHADLQVFGVPFPGHFLLRAPHDAGDDGEPTILDPFDGGRRLGRPALRALLARHAGEDVRFDSRLLAPCGARQIVVRMLNNL